MRIRGASLAGLLVTGMLALGLPAAAQDVSPGTAVVRIQTWTDSGKHVGTGFAWSSPDRVVTALHVVAGAKRIRAFSEATGKSASATVIAAMHEPDLALLQLDQDIGLKPLNHAAAEANSTAAHFVWGYPHDVAEMTRHRVQIVGGLNREPTLASIFKSDSQLKRTLGKQGYPQLQSRVIRVDKIQPGHSGAPLVNTRGEVIGVGDGGLRDGLGGLNWAIPAAIYLPRLAESRDPIPGSPSLQTTLFGAGADPEAETEPLPLTEAGDNRLRKVWSATLAQIVEALDEDALEIFVEIDAESRAVSGFSIEEALIDVYEDEATGATFAVPAGMLMDYYGEDGVMVVATPAGNELVVRISRHGDWQQGLDGLHAFADELTEDPQWLPDPEAADDWEIDPAESFAEVSLYRVGGPIDEDGRYGSLLDATLVIDGGSFLGTAVITRDTLDYSDRDWFEYYLMAACVELADFVSY